MVNAPQCKATAGTRRSHNLKLRTRSKLNLHLHLEFHPQSKRPSLPLGHKKSLGFPASLSYIPTVAITSLSHYTLASVSGNTRVAIDKMRASIPCRSFPNQDISQRNSAKGISMRNKLCRCMCVMKPSTCHEPMDVTYECYQQLK